MIASDHPVLPSTHSFGQLPIQKKIHGGTRPQNGYANQGLDSFRGGQYGVWRGGGLALPPLKGHNHSSSLRLAAAVSSMVGRGDRGGIRRGESSSDEMALLAKLSTLSLPFITSSLLIR